MNQQTETAKVFKKMGASIGITKPRKSHRGIIARRFLERTEAREMRYFENSLRYFAFPS